MRNPEGTNVSASKRLRNDANFAPLLASVEADEEVLAIGTTTIGPLAVTEVRAIRAGHEAAVSIPFAAVERGSFS